MAEVIKTFKSHVGWADSSGAWPGMVFSTRVRFARNIEGFEFTGRAHPDRLAGIRKLAFAALKGTGLFPRGHFLKTETLAQVEKGFLTERHHISPNLASTAMPAGAVISEGEDISVMVNEEDHLRLQCLVSGFAIPEAFAGALKLDEAAGAELSFAFDGKFGFLTACPTNAGTAMRISCLVHLPGMTRLGRMPATLESLSHLGVMARGIYGEGTCVLGDFYQISNAACLGRSEEEFCRNMDTVVRNLVRQEVDAREHLMKPGNKLRTEDGVYRALGVLRHARSLSYTEFMQNLSLVRMGAALGWPMGLGMSDFNQLTLLMQPAHLQAAAGKVLSPEARDAFRADSIRKKF